MTTPPACTSCGRALKAHCPTADPGTTRCSWWRCTNRVCAVDIHDSGRRIRRLTNGVTERIAQA